MINNIRVWDKKKKTMKGVQLCVCGVSVEDLDRYKIMMSNMTMDKNGKPIFEGDIVKFNRIGDEDSCIFGIVKLEGGQFIIEQLTVNYYLKKDGYKVLNSFYDYDGSAFFLWEQLEVVGNIYDNSKLYRSLLNRKRRMPKRKSNSSMCRDNKF
jgi:uncharacterized phage protein (TIGR01671 family)